jgi:enamine deaminase RidA (YjgF/YER057c/UK114 family)
MAKGVTYLNPSGAPKTVGLYSHVAIVEGGRVAHIAGQISADATGNVVGAGNPAAQIAQVFANLEAVLKGLGADFKCVCAFTTYIVGAAMREPWLTHRTEIYKRIYPDGSYPPNTLLVIEGLARPEYLVEISAIARLPD